MCHSKLQRLSITDYVGTILNRAEYCQQIKHKYKRFEIKTYQMLGLPPWIIFHPSRDLRKIWHSGRATSWSNSAIQDCQVSMEVAAGLFHVRNQQRAEGVYDPVALGCACASSFLAVSNIGGGGMHGDSRD